MPRASARRSVFVVEETTNTTIPRWVNQADLGGLEDDDAPPYRIIAKSDHEGGGYR